MTMTKAMRLFTIMDQNMARGTDLPGFWVSCEGGQQEGRAQLCGSCTDLGNVTDEVKRHKAPARSLVSDVESDAWAPAGQSRSLEEDEV